MDHNDVPEKAFPIKYVVRVRLENPKENSTFGKQIKMDAPGEAIPIKYVVAHPPRDSLEGVLGILGGLGTPLGSLGDALGSLKANRNGWTTTTYQKKRFQSSMSCE